MTALRRPEDVADTMFPANLGRSTVGAERSAAAKTVRVRDREVAAWLLRVSETAGMTPGGVAALVWAAKQIVPEAEKVGEEGRAPDPEEHPLDALRRLTPPAPFAHGIVVVPAPVLAYALSEIDRLTEALAAAVREREEAEGERDHYGRERDDARRERNALQDEIGQLRCPREEAPPSPLVALASEIARGPMGQGLVAWLPPEAGSGQVRVDTTATADNVLAVARRILGAM